MKSLFRHISSLFAFSVLLVVTFLCLDGSILAQPDCGNNVPHFEVDLTGSPDSVYFSPSVSRVGTCCDVSHPDRCVSFTVTLDENAIGFIFENVSGADPPGSLFYQIDCGEVQPTGTPICLNGGQTYYITYCKPGANQNIYSITSIPGTIATAPVVAQVECDYELSVSGPEVSTIEWNDITSGTGAYNAFLSCTSGCDVTEFTPDKSSPQFIEYEVCGMFEGGGCLFDTIVCDTVLVEVVFLPEVAIEPTEFCEDDVSAVVATLSDYPSTYSYFWYSGPNATGSIVGSNTSFVPSQAGEYSLVYIDNQRSGCSRDTVNFDVNIYEIPSIVIDEFDPICPGDTVWLGLPDAYAYEFSPSDVVFEGAVAGEYYIIVTSTTSFDITVTNGECEITDIFEIPVEGCMSCPLAINVCPEDEVMPYSSLSSFLDAGGTANFPCNISIFGFDSADESDDGVCPEIITRTYTIIDDCGNTGACTQTITLNDTEPPNMTCPDDLETDCGIDQLPAYTSFNQFIDGGGSAIDDCGIDESSFTLISETSNEEACPEVVTRLYQIYDMCGNTSTCSQNITINDTIPPVIACSDITIEACEIEDYPSFDSLSDFLSSGGTVSDNFTIDSSSFILIFESSDGNTCPEVIQREYQVSDICGNTSSCTQTIIINDTTAPTISCPVDITSNVGCDDSEIENLTGLDFSTTVIQISESDFLNLDGAPALSDNCEVSHVTYQDNMTSSGCQTIVHRTFIAYDLCGNASSPCTQVITINDETGPDVQCPADIEVECLEDVPGAYSNFGAF